jgi:predicted nucleic acid-binding protein
VIAPKIVIHTDVIAQYLLHKGSGEPVLRLAMMKFFCYTTVFSAMELFALARLPRECTAVEDALSGMKILGLNAKSAKTFGMCMSKGLRLQRMNTLVAAMCLESKLPILTLQPNDFRGVKGLVVVPASAVRNNRSAVEILSARLRSVR